MSYFLHLSRIFSLFIIGIFTVLSFYSVLLLFNLVYTLSIELGLNSDSLICSISTLSSNLILTKLEEKNIPWDDTDMMKNNRVILNKIYDHYSDNPKVKSFLDAKVNHLLSAPTADTGIPYSSLTKNSILSNPETKVLTAGYTPSLFTTKSGVYGVLAHNFEDLYVGSATNFFTRFNNHYSSLRDVTQLNTNSSKFYMALRNLGPVNFSWFPIVVTPNYYQEFVSLYKELNDLVKDNNIFNILLLFTQYEARSYEQAILSAIKPSLNTDYIVSFTLNWDSEREYGDFRGSKPVQAIEQKTGNVHYFSSIRQAANILKIDKRNIQTYLNYMNFHYCAVLGEFVRFFDVTKPMNVGHPYSNENMPLFSEIDYNEIPLGQIWAYNESFQKIGEFSSSLKAASNFNISKGTVLRNLNIKFTNGIYNGVTTSVLFCRNILGAINKKISVVVIDQKINQAYLYPTISSASQAIGMGESINSGTVRNKWIKTGKLYKDRWLIVEESNYNGANILKGPATLV